MNTSNMVITLLAKTNNGKDLSYRHQALINCALHCRWPYFWLSDFLNLCERVNKGVYQKQELYLYGIQFITKDVDGNIYYKGDYIDQFRSYYWKLERTAAKRAFLICSLLESKGLPINPMTYKDRVMEYLTTAELQEIGKINHYFF